MLFFRTLALLAAVATTIVADDADEVLDPEALIVPDFSKLEDISPPVARSTVPKAHHKKGTKTLKDVKTIYSLQSKNKGNPLYTCHYLKEEEDGVSMAIANATEYACNEDTKVCRSKGAGAIQTFMTKCLTEGGFLSMDKAAAKTHKKLNS